MTAPRALAALLLALLVTPSGPLDAAPRDERPFPVESTTILREGRVNYVVEGRRTIGKGVDISCQKDVHIRGKGANPTIVVEGTLKVHGVSLREVIFEGVTIELAREFRDVQLDMAIFRAGGGVVTPKDEPAKGKLFIENVSFSEGARVDVSLSGGSVDLSSVNSGMETTIRGADTEGETRNRVKVKIRACSLTGLLLENVFDATVRLSRLAEGRAEFRDCGTLIFDANKVNAETLELRHSAAGGFKKTKILKCDIYSKKLVVRAPTRGGRSVDRVLVDKCWFKGETDTRVLREEVITDAEDDAGNGARVHLQKPQKRPHELAGAVDR